MLRHKRYAKIFLFVALKISLAIECIIMLFIDNLKKEDKNAT